MLHVSGKKNEEKKISIGVFVCKNLVRPVSQGKPQSQDFIDELCGLSHMFVQTVSLACWYPLSFTDRVSSRSSLLLSVLQVVDSRPSWILVSVLGELRSTSGIADILPVCLSLSFGLNTLSCVYRLFLVCGFVFLVDGKKSFVRFHHPICSYSGLRPVFTRFLFHFCACWSCLYLFPMPKKVCAPVLVSGVLFWLFIGISGPLWGFCSKNLIRLVRSGKPLGLFSVTRPYARF